MFNQKAFLDHGSMENGKQFIAKVHFGSNKVSSKFGVYKI
jgi:hypothetical protein